MRREPFVVLVDSLRSGRFLDIGCQGPKVGAFGRKPDTSLGDGQSCLWAPCVDGLQNRLHDTPIGHVALNVISVDDVDLARRRQPRLRQIQQSLTDRAGSTTSGPTVPWRAHDGGSRAFGFVRRDRAGRCRLSGSWPPSDLPPPPTAAPHSTAGRRTRAEGETQKGAGRTSALKCRCGTAFRVPA